MWSIKNSQAEKLTTVGPTSLADVCLCGNWGLTSASESDGSTPVVAADEGVSSCIDSDALNKENIHAHAYISSTTVIGTCMYNIKYMYIVVIYMYNPIYSEHTEKLTPGCCIPFLAVFLCVGSLGRTSGPELDWSEVVATKGGMSPWVMNSA